MSNFSNSFKHLLGILIVMVGPPQVSLQDQVLDESDHVHLVCSLPNTY
jgi:hypothetical protein